MHDIDTIASELLRALRGRRSQVAFSRRLGYRSNVAATWEGGRRWPTAATTLRAAARTGVDLQGGLRRFFKVEARFLEEHAPESPEGVAAFLRDLRGERALVEIAEHAGASRYQVSRWLSGTSEPRLPQFLALVDAISHRLLDYVAVLVDPAELPSTAAAWRRLEAARSLFWRMPHAMLVLLALDLEDYHALPGHDDHFLAERLGLELYDVASALDRLADTGQIKREGDHWAPDAVQTVDTRRHPAAGAAMKRWWAARALDRLDAPETSWSTNAFSVAEADLPRIIELYRSTYRQMRAIVSTSAPAERLVLLQQGIVPLDRPPASDTG